MNMNYYYNQNGNLVTVSENELFNLKDCKFTNIPIKPINWQEKAYFKNVNWNYEFENYSALNDLRKSTKQESVRIFSEATRFCKCSSGTYVKPKSKEISILIPCYKKQDFVLETVISSINQTLKPFEVIVLLMDEQSKKLKPKLQELSPLVTCIESNKLNSVASRNYLVELCKTEYFVFLDADDILQPNFIEEVYNDKASIVFAKMSRDKNKSDYKYGDNYQSTYIAQNQNLTFLLCKEAFYEIKLDESLWQGGEDADFILRLFYEKKWKIGFTLKTFFWYREQDTNSLSNKKEFYTSHFFMLKKNRKILSDIVTRSVFCKEPIIDFLKDEKNFVDEDVFNKKAREFFELNYNHSDEVNQFFELLKISRERNTENIFSEDEYFVPKQFTQHHILQGRTFDAIILSVVNNYYIFSKPQLVIKKSIQKELDKLNVSDYQKLIYLLENYSVFYYPVLESTVKPNVEVLNIPVTFELHKQCNADCEYCNQKSGRPYKVFSDDQMYELFDKAVSKVEKVYNKRFIPQILGGEPTMWSDYFINKVVNRLKDCEYIYLMTNRLIKNSAWENYSNIFFSNHILDLTSANRINTKVNENYIIVVHHKNIQYLSKFLETNSDVTIRVDEYIGDIEEFKLTESDYELLEDLFYKYQNVNSQILFSRKIRQKENLLDDFEICKTLANPIIIDCGTQLVIPCCNYNQDKIKLDDFNGQLPNTNQCKDCPIILRVLKCR